MATVMTAPSQTPSTRRETSERATRTVAPRVDIYETDKTYVLLADMPGVPPEGLEVVAEGDGLIVRGRVERPAPTPDYQEFELAEYYRTFSLTEDLDAGGITATLRDGVLRIEIPKSPRMQPKKIPVRTQ
jgi:HSP20 family molecular chaperone IbpA